MTAIMGGQLPRDGTRMPNSRRTGGIRHAVAARVTRAETGPLLPSITEISRELLWIMSTPSDRHDVYVRADLVAYGGAVEVELVGAGAVIRRSRFVRDGEARLYGARVRREFEQRGYGSRSPDSRDEDR